MLFWPVVAQILTRSVEEYTPLKVQRRRSERQCQHEQRVMPLVDATASKRTSPPCCRASRQAIGKPRPRPRPADRPEKTGSNRCSRIAGAGPAPLSSTTSFERVAVGLLDMDARPAIGRRRFDRVAQQAHQGGTDLSRVGVNGFIVVEIGTRANVTPCGHGPPAALQNIPSHPAPTPRIDNVLQLRHAGAGELHQIGQNPVNPLRLADDLVQRWRDLRANILKVFADVLDLLGRHPEPVHFVSTYCAWPEMTASGLLISCPAPAANSARADSFDVCRRFFSSLDWAASVSCMRSSSCCKRSIKRASFVRQCSSASRK